MNSQEDDDNYHGYAEGYRVTNSFQWLYHKSHMCMCVKPRRILTISEWPTSPIVWLVYRLSAAVVVSMIFSFNFLGHLLLYLDFLNTLRFFIYLTNWGLAVLVVCFIFKAHLSLKYFSVLDDSEEFFSFSHQFTWAWILNNISNTCALGVTFGYWLVVYDGRRVTVPNMNAHIFNSVMTLVDVLLVSSPVHIAHFYQPFLFGLFYLCFTLFYYLVGGTDHEGNSAIYAVLNWDHPGRTVLIGVVGGSLVVIAMHSLIWLVTCFRQKCRRLCA